MIRNLLPAMLCLFPALAARADDWPQYLGPTRDSVWHETGVVERFPGPEIKLRWKVPVAAGYSGPTVAQGRVYVTDHVTTPTQAERVHCFDWETGRKLWSFAYRHVFNRNDEELVCASLAAGETLPKREWWKRSKN
jgi:outer membrane protein assembly factor BamB